MNSINHHCYKKLKKLQCYMVCQLRAKLNVSDKNRCEPPVAVRLRPSTTEPCICCQPVAEKLRGEHLRCTVTATYTTVTTDLFCFSNYFPAEYHPGYLVCNVLKNIAASTAASRVCLCKVQESPTQDIPWFSGASLANLTKYDSVQTIKIYFYSRF